AARPGTASSLDPQTHGLGSRINGNVRGQLVPSILCRDALRLWSARAHDRVPDLCRALRDGTRSAQFVSLLPAGPRFEDRNHAPSVSEGAATGTQLDSTACHVPPDGRSGPARPRLYLATKPHPGPRPKPSRVADLNPALVLGDAVAGE